jgi:hypothetical protein
MRFLISFLILAISGCASVQMPGYISRVDHPYDRKFYAGFEKVVSSTMYVLKNKGWKIESEADPAIYERDERYDNDGYQNLLIMTRVRKDLSSMASMHLNVLIHSLGNACDVEIRYEAQTPLIKRFTSERNDKIVQGIFDAVEKDING